MKWPAMGYARVESLDELWRALDAAGPEAQILAGGQSLLATLAFRLSAPSTLIDITRIAALKGVSVGERAAHRRAHPPCRSRPRPLVARHAPMLAEAAPLIAHPAIRNRGTIGGSLALADPRRGAAGLRRRPRGDAGPRLPRGRAPRPPPTSSRGFSPLRWTPARSSRRSRSRSRDRNSRQTIVEVTRRSGDYAMAGLAAALEVDGGVVTSARLVFFGIGSGAEVARGASAALTGKALSADPSQRRRPPSTATSTRRPTFTAARDEAPPRPRPHPPRPRIFPRFLGAGA